MIDDSSTSAHGIAAQTASVPALPGDAGLPSGVSSGFLSGFDVPTADPQQVLRVAPGVRRANSRSAAGHARCACNFFSCTCSLHSSLVAPALPPGSSPSPVPSPTQPVCPNPPPLRPPVPTQAVLKREVAKFDEAHVKNGTALGELDHPNYASCYFRVRAALGWQGSPQACRPRRGCVSSRAWPCCKGGPTSCESLSPPAEMRAGKRLGLRGSHG
eukprot:359406-Chlamydomonas_euryale.AAC.6